MTARDGWLDRGGVGLHFLEWAPHGRPQAGPAILLLHGLSSNARYWERVAGQLLSRRIVALDQRGHGLTGRSWTIPPVPQAFAMDELVGDVMFSIDQLGLGRPVIAGHSWGATVALEVAGGHSDAISGLVFVDGPVQSPSKMLSWAEAQTLMQPPLPAYATMAEAVADSRQDFGSAWGPDLEPFVDARVMRDGDGFILTLTAAVRLDLLRGLYDSNADELWPRVNAPAEVLVGLHSAARMSRWTESALARLQVIAPHVEIKRFASPHDIPLYLPAEVAAEIEHIASVATA